MKPNNKLFLVIVMFVCCFLILPAVTNAQDRGVVLVAHGSKSNLWNEQVKDFQKGINSSLSLPVNVGFLHFARPTLEDAVNDLKNDKGVTNILLVHLSPSSYSERHNEVHDRKDSLEQSDPSLDLKVSPAMNDHPSVIKILKQYVDDLSLDPEYESLILVSYGAVSELLNIAWVRQFEQIGKKIQADLGFREVACLTLRNHSADLIRTQAIVDLQRTARRLKEKGRVIVVPYVLCILPDDSFQRELRSHLRGIVPPKYIGDEGVLQSFVSGMNNADEWVKKIVDGEIHEPEFRDANRTWSVMDREKGAPIGTNKYGSYAN